MSADLNADAIDALFPSVADMGITVPEVRTFPFGISGKAPQYVWSPRARQLHASVGRGQDGLLKKLLEGNSRSQAAALLLLCPYLWEGDHAFPPKNSIRADDAVKYRKSYASRVNQILRKYRDPRRQLWSLIYFHAFPDVIDAELLIKLFSQAWKNEVSWEEDFHDLILREGASIRPACLAGIAFIVLCRAEPKRALSIAIENSRKNTEWWVPIVRTPAQLYIDQETWDRIPSIEVRRKVATGIGYKVRSLAYGRDSFLRRIQAPEDTVFPQRTIEVILSDNRVSRDLRSELVEEAKWLERAGEKVDWLKAPAQDVVGSLRRLYEREPKRRESSP